MKTNTVLSEFGQLHRLFPRFAMTLGSLSLLAGNQVSTFLKQQDNMTLNPTPTLARRMIIAGRRGFLQDVSFSALAWMGAGVFGDSPAWASESDSATASLAEPLRALEHLFDRVFTWLPRVYDAQQGGFFESLALRKAGDRFGPDIQSSAQALRQLQAVGLVKVMPTAMREAMVRYFQSRQDAQTGFFIDPHYPQMRENVRVRGRALSFAVGALHTLGAKPLHPLPGRRSAGLPPHVASPEAFRTWLDSLSWDQSSWSALDRLQSQGTLLRSLPPEQGSKLTELAYRYVQDRQDPETGLAGGGSPIVRISGAAKFGWFCLSMKLPIPRADAIQQTTLDWYRSRPTVDTLTLLRNPINLLMDLEQFVTKKLSSDDRRMVVGASAGLLQSFSQEDGAFSMQTKRFPMAPNDLLQGQAPGPQSDMNGTAQAHHIRESAYHLAGVRAPAIARASEFFSQ
jgi:hypothetical protein